MTEVLKELKTVAVNDQDPLILSIVQDIPAYENIRIQYEVYFKFYNKYAGKKGDNLRIYLPISHSLSMHRIDHLQYKRESPPVSYSEYDSPMPEGINVPDQHRKTSTKNMYDNSQ